MKGEDECLTLVPRQQPTSNEDISRQRPMRWEGSRHLYEKDCLRVTSESYKWKSDERPTPTLLWTK